MGTINQTVAQGTLTALSTNVEKGTPVSSLHLYSGTPPTNVSTALSGNTLLSKSNLPSNVFNAPSGRTITAKAIADVAAIAGGTATFFRLVNGDDEAVYQGDAGETTEECVLDESAIIQGGNVKINSITISA